MTRVLVVMPGGKVSGAERVLLELLDAGPSATVTVACPPASPLADELAGRGVPTVPFSLPLLGDVGPARYAAALARAVAAAHRAVRSEAPDVVHAFVTPALKVAAPVARLHRRPVVFSVHDVLAAEGIGRLRSSVLRVLGNGLVDRIVAVSDFIRTGLVEDVGIRSDRVVTVHNGVDPARVAGSPADRARRRAEWGVPDDAVVFALFGRLMEWKGQRVAIEAMDRVEAQHPGAAHLVLQGDAFGPRDVAYAVQLRAEAERRPYVTLQPGAPTMGPSYAASDVVLVPSTSPDPFPTVVLEAGAAGRPTIVTDRGGGREAVVDGVTGIVAAPTADALSAAMAELLDPSRRDPMGDAARRHVTTELGVARYCTQIEHLWDEVAGA